MKTYASNPGNTRIKVLRLLWHMPRVTLILGGGALALFYFGYVESNALYSLGGTACIALLFFVLDRAKYRFRDGDVNISKVLSLNPPLFATSTNMRNTGGAMKFPVVKIVRGRVPNVRGRRLKVGDYFPAACLYSGDFDKPHWDNFFPVPISAATDDLATIEHHDQELEYLRDELDLRLSLVDTPDKPGIYFLDEARLAQRKARSKAAGVAHASDGAQGSGQ